MCKYDCTLSLIYRFSLLKNEKISMHLVEQEALASLESVERWCYGFIITSTAVWCMLSHHSLSRPNMISTYLIKAQQRYIMSFTFMLGC